ncbi:hypothetical protein Syun_005363 [Stephania yunnanensis]|uniref:BHLH domain-containing protein n=1 Tax=Stephania yunnanensis TaxID=152371 RepID=A0AAP0L527_9MAGN
MDQWKSEGFRPSVQTNLGVSDFHQLPTDPLSVPPARLQPESSQRQELEVKNPVAARKVQKADREKLRRDRLNEQFLELGHALDPERPKNDKATILSDTIQVLKDLTSQVNRMKAECSALSEESRELAQEKNELREEKASLKSEIDNLNVQYQQRLRVMFPWTIDPAVVMAPPSYPFPVQVPVPAGPIAMHPSLQPYPFFRNQNPGAIPNPCSTFVPYSVPATQVDQPSSQYLSPQLQPSSRSHSPGKDTKNKSTDPQKSRNGERKDDSNDVATDLELKMPGSTTDEELTGEKKNRQFQKKGSSITDGSCSSRCSSSREVQDSSSSSVGDRPKVDN